MVGGGIQNELLCQLTANFARKPVITGPIEASALGECFVSIVKLWGIVQSREEAQKLIRQSELLKKLFSRRFG